MKLLSRFSLLALSAALLFSACGGTDDNTAPDTGRITLNATATYGSLPLVMFDQNYDYEDGMQFQMQLFQTYLSDIELVYMENGAEMTEPLLDVALAEFGDIYTIADAEAGIEVVKTDVPARNYTALRFGVGVSPALNATVPPDYEVTHPLGQNYWEDANSYIFFKFEGNADLDGSGGFQDKLTFHVGGDNNYNSIEFTGAIDIAPDGEAVLNLNFDMEKLLIRSNGDYVDFRQVRQAHSNTAPAAVFMGENMPNALSLTR
ncbi:MbnP family protein [Phaeodactylibacter luteus]|uniref:Copper-binding protein MbnP-like domain-containing protein n=1 Tax=Phaeodactylibacter luteus TaxID=1564516 RepID=A0A5C6S6P0_9BACT|nr:MbnP family protein [Phaeodactylibacter luteus]TXB69482.1 hypothetical protein FRY97_01345 [Phaeodactylibacter luteus]